MTLNASSWLVGSSAGTKTVAVTSNVSWEVSSDAGWLTVLPASGTGNGTFVITAAANPSITARTGTVTVQADSITRTVAVTQAAAPPNMTLNASSWSAISAGGTKTVAVTSNTNWAVSSGAGWLTVSPASGSLNGSFVITAAANTATAARTGTVTVQAGAITRTVSVTQAKAASLVLDNESWALYNDGGTATVSVTSNADWAISNESAIPDWLEVSADYVNNTIAVTADDFTNATQNNITGDDMSRTATITVSAGTPETGIVTKEIIVTQFDEIVTAAAV